MMRDIEEIKRDCELATDGPWLVCREAFVTYRGATADNDFICQGFDLFEDDFYNWDANARFIAHARQDVPDLVAEVERLHTANRLLLEERAAVRKALGEHFIAIADEDGNPTDSAYYMDQGVGMLATQWQFSQDQLEQAHQELAEAKAEVERLRAELTTTLVGCARCGQGVPPRYAVLGMCPTCAAEELRHLREEVGDVQARTEGMPDEALGWWDRAQRFCDEHADDYDVLNVEPRVSPAGIQSSFVLVWFVTELDDDGTPSVDELLERVDLVLAEDGRTLIRSLTQEAGSESR